MINTVRQSTSVVMCPKGNTRAARVTGSADRTKLIEQKHEEEHKLPDLDLDACMSILTQDEHLHRLGALLGRPPGGRSRPSDTWHTSYVSADTFFENKTGFDESMLTESNSFTMFLRPSVRQLLLQPHKLPGLEQRRGFKAERKPTGMGTTRSDTSSDMATMLGRILPVKRSALDPSVIHGSLKKENQNDIATLLKSTKDKESQDRIKIAFAEGYAAKPPSRISWLTFLKYTIYALCAYYLYQRLGMSGGDMSGSGFRSMMPNSFEVNPEEVNVKFDDVKGVDEAKEELKDIVNYLQNPDKFKALGAKLPKGVLLVGSPGIGKTLLAKAIAGEAGVPFFHASGSEFDEMFVGSGSRKVRQLFSSAKQRAPCLVFIDEIDSVGAKRTNSQIHPYANQTINQLLSEMDGFSPNDGIIVLGATNKRENLDFALVRPGRFDVEVKVYPPDVKGRMDIFELYLKKINAAPDLNLERLAKLTTGFTGAHIENIVNQAALRAASVGEGAVTMEHLDYARDKVLMGPEWKNKKIDIETNTCTAYHEAGHTLVALHTKDAMSINKVTILPRGQALGVTELMDQKEPYNRSKAELLAQIDVSMGGRVAEELKFGAEKVTTGASSDLMRATNIATQMVKHYGMSEKVGQRYHESDESDGGSRFIKINNTSPELQDLIDNEINRILQESYNRAKDILRKHSDEHERLSQALLKYETLTCEEVTAVTKGKPIRINTKKPVIQPTAV